MKKELNFEMVTPRENILQRTHSTDFNFEMVTPRLARRERERERERERASEKFIDNQIDD